MADTPETDMPQHTCEWCSGPVTSSTSVMKKTCDNVPSKHYCIKCIETIWDSLHPSTQRDAEIEVLRDLVAYFREWHKSSVCYCVNRKELCGRCAILGKIDSDLAKIDEGAQIGQHST